MGEVTSKEPFTCCFARDGSESPFDVHGPSSVAGNTLPWSSEGARDDRLSSSGSSKSSSSSTDVGLLGGMLEEMGGAPGCERQSREPPVSLRASLVAVDTLRNQPRLVPGERSGSGPLNSTLSRFMSPRSGAERNWYLESPQRESRELGMETNTLAEVMPQVPSARRLPEEHGIEVDLEEPCDRTQESKLGHAKRNSVASTGIEDDGKLEANVNDMLKQRNASEETTKAIVVEVMGSVSSAGTEANASESTPSSVSAAGDCGDLRLVRDLDVQPCTGWLTPGIYRSKYTEEMNRDTWTSPTHIITHYIINVDRHGGAEVSRLTRGDQLKPFRSVHGHVVRASEDVINIRFQLDQATVTGEMSVYRTGEELSLDALFQSQMAREAAARRVPLTKS
uniref:Uncharacterized protein n=1 Tax=Noctiluca scintillans TaxID=2966 RepID=A0A7S1F3H2_NOCSC